MALPSMGRRGDDFGDEPPKPPEETPAEYPQHQAFKAKQAEMFKAKEFLEWLISDEADRPRDSYNKCRVCGADEIIPLHSLGDKDKEKLIMRFFDIDYDAFYAEKEAMVAVMVVRASGKEEKSDG